MTIHEDIAKISKLLMFDEPFYGLFLLTLNKVIREDVGTAGVSKNGINMQLAVAPKFWNALQENWKKAILKHELLHIVFFHLNLRDSFPDKYLFNIAADIEVNQYIDQSWHIPAGHEFAGFHLDTYPDLNLPPKAGTKVYYDALQQALKKSNGGQCTAPGTGQAHANGSGHPTPSLQQVMDAQQAGACQMHMTWDEFEALSEAEKDLLKKQVDFQIKDMVENNKKSCGKVPGELQQYIDSLFKIEPPVFNWKAYLRRFVGASQKTYTKKTRRKESKRFSGSPALRIKTKQHILVAVDTSGSVSETELIEFFNEIYHIWKTGVAVTVAQCDADIHSIEEYKGKFDGRINGRGGTSFQPPVDYFDKHSKTYTTLVFFTDGYAPTPTRPRNKMLWVISSRGKGAEDLPWFQIKIPGETGS
jgi:predicted metal-dependent peptidase